ncbi:MAG: UbiA prenyltransferase family protein [Caldilineaceae bacterium]|nr:UbiA prenyltransferase family protein [Caldilineaceae bacterium]
MATSASSGAGRSLSRFATARTLFIHLRLHFQILLAPIFLWGVFLAGGSPNLPFWIAFVAFHLCLYGGTTAFNSYYDRDEGPVGGLEKPPPVVNALLPFSLILQGIGAGLATLVNLPFLVIYLIIFVMGAAYSHPHTRWKANPLGGLATVAIGQGVLAGLGGWVVANADLAAISPLHWIGLIAASAITVGFYPLTQIYQIDEDLGRGDLTFAAWVGPRGSFIYAIIVMTLAALALLFVILRLLGPLNAGMVAIFYGGLLAFIVHWALTYDPAQIVRNFRRVMRIYMLTSLGFIGFIGWHLVVIQ